MNRRTPCEDTRGLQPKTIRIPELRFKHKQITIELEAFAFHDSLDSNNFICTGPDPSRGIKLPRSFSWHLERLLERFLGCSKNRGGLSYLVGDGETTYIYIYMYR